MLLYLHHYPFFPSSSSSPLFIIPRAWETDLRLKLHICFHWSLSILLLSSFALHTSVSLSSICPPFNLIHLTVAPSIFNPICTKMQDSIFSQSWEIFHSVYTLSIYYFFFSQSSVLEYMSSFHILATVNTDRMHKYMQISFQINVSVIDAKERVCKVIWKFYFYFGGKSSYFF